MSEMSAADSSSNAYFSATARNNWDAILDRLAAATAERDKIITLVDPDHCKDFYRLDEEVRAIIASGECAMEEMTKLGDLLDKVTAERDALKKSDDPTMDATDFAHPAWWRGHGYSVAVVCQKIGEILDGKPLAGVSNEPWEPTRQRIAALVAENASLRAQLDGRWIKCSERLPE